VIYMGAEKSVHANCQGEAEKGPLVGRGTET